MFICEKDSHCIDCPKNYSNEECEHYVEVKPVRHGRWMRKEDNQYYCSYCNKSIGYIIDISLPNYCPICGAKMDEVEE